MVIAYSKNAEMTFFFLPKQHPLTRSKGLAIDQYYTKDQLIGSRIPVPYGYVPVWCQSYYFTGSDFWRNPLTNYTYNDHPLGLTERETGYSDGFYEMTSIIEIEEFNGLSTELNKGQQWTFREGHAWCFETNTVIVVEKTDPTSIWNPFFQRYDKQCCRTPDSCEPLRIEYDSEKEDFHSSFNGDMTQFLGVYCRCTICQYCDKVHECFYYCKEQTGP